MEREILYIASGRRYIDRMLTSVESVREHMPAIHITAVADQEIESPLIDDNIVYDGFNQNNGDSIIRPEFVRADRTLFLDVDTHVSQDLSELFELLDQYDIAATHNPERIPEWFEDESSYRAQDVPEAFPQYNTGVILFKKNDVVLDLFSKWWQIYQERVEGGFMFNQPAFREALYRNETKQATLPPEYNVRLNRPGYLNGPAKILHGWHPDIEEVEKNMNKSTTSRVYTLDKWPIRIIEYNKSLSFEVIESLKRNGVLHTVRAGMKRVLKRVEGGKQ